jgi:hypothetical protein
MYLADYKFCWRALIQTEKVEAIRKKAHLSLCQWCFTLWFQECWEQSLSYEVEEMEHSGALLPAQEKSLAAE